MNFGLFGQAGFGMVHRDMLSNPLTFSSILKNPFAFASLINNKNFVDAFIVNHDAMTSVAASSTAVTAINANATVSNTVLGSSYSVGAYLDRLRIIGGLSTDTTLAAQDTMTAVAASSTAMASVWASNTAADAVLTSTTARLAVYNADTALTALQADPTQVARQIGISGRTTSASTAVGSFVFVANNTKVILLRRYYSGTEIEYIDWQRGATTAIGVTSGSGGRTLDTGVQALGCTSGTYTSNGIIPTTNDATANFVSAANGLQRRTWVNGATLYVNYITV